MSASRDVAMILRPILGLTGELPNGAAALGDRYGRRNLYAAGLGLFTAASALCALGDL